MTFNVKGVGELKFRLQKFPKDAALACAFGEYAAAQVIMVDARARTPVEEGWLQAGGYAAKPSMTSAGNPSVKMGFGGAAEEYIAKQHYDTTLNHPNGGEAMFFSNALDAKMTEAQAIIADYVRQYVTTGRMPPLPTKLVPESPTEELGPVKTTRHGRHG